MSPSVFLNDQPYKDGEEDPRESLRTVVAFAADDWGETRAKAWVYGIVLGWDVTDGPADPDDDAMAELAEKFRWDAPTVARLRRLHAAFAGDTDRAGGRG